MGIGPHLQGPPSSTGQHSPQLARTLLPVGTAPGLREQVSPVGTDPAYKDNLHPRGHAPPYKDTSIQVDSPRLQGQTLAYRLLSTDGGMQRGPFKIHRE
jgi:hypothetical protein